MRSLSALAIVLLLASCSAKKEEAEVQTTPETPQEAANTFTLSPNDMQNPTNAVASVNGEILRLADVNTETRIRLSNVRGTQVGPEMITQMRSVVVEQFITRALLLGEAKKRELTVSEDDLNQELAAIQKMVPEGMTIEEVLNSSPLGREAMLEHVRNKIVIDKLSSQLMKDDVEVSDEEVEEFIEQNKADLAIPESVEARHILMKFEPGDDDKAKDGKKDELEKLRKEIEKGADFAEVAKEHSQCPSGKSGGFLGKFRKGDMVPEFSEAAFSQKVGEVGKVITTKFGHHIIKVESHEKESTFPREDIEERIKDLKMQSVMMKFIGELRGKADIKVY